jgi:hypothetical protein
MKVTAFWDTAPRSLVEVYRRFRDAYCLHHQGDDGAVRTSETSKRRSTSTNYAMLYHRTLSSSRNILMQLKYSQYKLGV